MGLGIVSGESNVIAVIGRDTNDIIRIKGKMEISGNIEYGSTSSVSN